MELIEAINRIFFIISSTAMQDNDIFSSDLNISNVDFQTSSSVRFDGSNLSFKQRNSPIHNPSSLDISSLHTSKLLNITPSHTIRTKLGMSLE